ncbi:MAG: hypothetical protein DRG50_03105 [Deltaproteobacteria bacterium]|nr:MAG: hypothetical protein DRG50_03105 [Deltaproteobacteria bacterium]
MKWVKGGVKIYVIVFILLFIFAISAVVLTPFICSGGAPVGPFRGEDCIRFNPNRLKVKKINKRWHIVEGNYDVIDFGPKKI